MSDNADVIVIGGGSTGTNVAGYARENGLSVAVVESRLVGGECSYWACMPSKALLGPVHAVAAARRLDGAAAAVNADIDPAAVFSRRDAFISELDDSGQVEWLESTGAELIRGKGRLVGERRVDVDRDNGTTRSLEANRAVVVATGSVPLWPPVDGLDSVGAWDNRDATTTTRVPDRLVVLGGGAVGCELAQAFARLGATVTIIERGDRILGNYGPELSGIITTAFESEGITVLTGAEALSVARNDGTGVVTVRLEGGECVEADELLVAAGRRLATDAIGLETVGVHPDRLDVDDYLRVVGIDGGWLYAAGDVNGRALLTHQGKYEARCVGDTIAGRPTPALADDQAVPQVVFTDPEVAAVGIGETEAGDGHRVVTVDIDSVAATALSGQTKGRAALVIDDKRNTVVGASFVGPRVGEVLHAATVAIVGQVPIETLWHAVPAFPTVSEVWLRLLETDRGVGTR